ncbi:hypothetical protein BLL40_09985 [Domibacillus mangrovi]|uniref:Uncharacterized protein n=2 Tax=Domibacillus mangrovi TaxID=1714354 RepID=A0A1Q5P2Y9_9BACI|nr:hypothetical protein BLL40_09985 [Domibacillus mangrovi]
MQIERLGAFRLTSLSFLRIMIRKMMKEAWEIERVLFSLDKEGYGEASYRIITPQGLFTFIVFSTEISDEERSDRVISEKWDVTFALCEGIPSDEKIERLRNELPKQEFGRGDVGDLVWSRANKSGRMFHHVIESLMAGKQPDLQVLTDIGYLLRTTAVYGNGKFGIAPYEKIKENHSFSGTFQAQMFAVYMLRHFSFELVEHIACQKNPNASKLHPEIKRFIGTGNATGLGMVPFLINHPRLLHQWVYIREKALARVKNIHPTGKECKRFMGLLNKSQIYFEQSPVLDVNVFVNPTQLAAECAKMKTLVKEYMENGTFESKAVEQPWIELTKIAKESASIDMQELLHSLLIEVHADHVVDLENGFNVDEVYELVPEMTIQTLQEIMKKQYSWALQYNFSDKRENHYFWYRSVEKEEPRMGICGEEPGEDRAMPLHIAKQVQELNDVLQGRSEDEMVAAFLLHHPECKGIVKRIQSLDGYEYGEVQCNLLSEDMLPIYLLRCKLAFFGAERFDPKSNRWVRITLFQGAPLVEEIGTAFDDTWIFPQLPVMEETK